MKNRTSTRSIKTLCALGLGVVLAGACGGRAVTVEDGMSAAGTGAGTSAVGGGVATGGGSGKPSGGGGGIGRAGSSGVAGAASGGAPNNCDAPCPPIACGSGSALVFPNGACCPTCVSNCPQQVCPAIACPSGYQLETQPGQCCPSCVPSSMLDCATGQMNYASQRDALLTKYAYGCTTDTDCIAATPTNRCEPGGCSSVAIWKGALDNLTSNLSSEADIDCAACGVVPVPPCTPPSRLLRCVGQQCQFWTPDDR
jgi:hypothetical protein